MLTKKTPFIKLNYDESNTALGFIDAVSAGAFGLAQAYLAKSLRASCELDYTQLKTIFADGGVLLRAVRFISMPRYVRPVTMMFGRDNAIVHLYTVYEPDSVSKWKIFGIEKE